MTNANGSDTEGETKRWAVEVQGESSRCAQGPSIPCLSAVLGLQLPPWDTQTVTQGNAAPHLATREGALCLPFEPPSLQGTIHLCMPCLRGADHPSTSHTRFSSSHCVKNSIHGSGLALEGAFLPHLELSLQKMTTAKNKQRDSSLQQQGSKKK